MSIAAGIYYSPRPIDLAEAVHRVPALAAVEAHDSRSERYGYVPTVHVLQGLIKEGFQIHGVQEAHVRKADRKGYQKHLIRMRKPDRIGGDGQAPEVIVINSHDGSSAFRIISGLIRFACANGLICGDTFDDVRVQHSGDVVSKVIDGAYRVVKDFDRIGAFVEESKAITLDAEESSLFATAAGLIRYGVETPAELPIRPEQMIRPRRSEDVGADLWRTFNRAQENAIRGGMHGRTRGANGRMRHTTAREVGGIDQTVSVNRKLWNLAEEFAKLKKGVAA